MGALADALKIVRFAVIAAEPASMRSTRGGNVAGRMELLRWILAGSFLIAAASYWLGIRSLDHDEIANQRSITLTPGSSTVRIPPVINVKPAPSDVEPKSLGAFRRNSSTKEEPPQPPLAKESPAPEREPATTDAKAPADAAKPGEESQGATPTWPVQEIEGADGRLVRVGRFATAAEAESHWQTVLRNNPAMRRFPTITVPMKSLRDGHPYYLLQVATASQAQSASVCERMRESNHPCTIIGADENSKDDSH